jgi:sporulation protein YlmC with PRC-barrel domain
VYTNELFGKEVLDSNANHVGKVADIDVDIQRGIVNHIAVKTGLTKKHIITLDKINKIGDLITLKISQDEL